MSVTERQWPDKTLVMLLRDGTEVSCTFFGRDLAISGSLIDEQNRTSALIGLTADWMASYRYACDVADAEYRAWRARMHDELRGKCVEAKEKDPSEHRAKAYIESHPDFMSYKEPIAALQSELAWLEGYHGALHAKIEMIKSRTQLETRDYNSIRSGMSQRVDAEDEPLPQFHEGRSIRPKTQDDVPRPRERSRDNLGVRMGGARYHDDE